MSDWLKDIENVLHAGAEWIRSLRRPPKPGTGSVTNKRENPNMANQWIYDIVNPDDSPVTDWQARKIEVTVDGVVREMIDVVPKDADTTPDVLFNEGSVVQLRWLDSDDGTPVNTSPASDPYEFAVNDDVAPPQPGMGGVTNKREVP